MKKKNTLLLAALTFTSLVVYAVVKKKNKPTREVPPDGAPQVHINNPGDQSEFLAAPTGYKDLG